MDKKSRLAELLPRMDELSKKDAADLTRDEQSELEEGMKEAKSIHGAIQREESLAAFTKTLAGIGTPGGAPDDPKDDQPAGLLSDALEEAGYNRHTKSAVMVEFKTATLDGGTEMESVNLSRVSQPALGFDERFLFPLFPSSRIDYGVTGIQSFRQASRNLGDAEDGVRDIAAVTPKPEVGTVAEIVDVPTHQIAWVSTDIPNILLENTAMKSFIDNDLRLAFSRSVDYHVTAQVIAASPPASPMVGATPTHEDLMYAIEAVLEEGYSPNVLAASPSALIQLALETEPGTGDYVGDKLDPHVARLRRVSVPGLATPLVMDATALGVLYISGSRFQSFEQEAGQTNQSTVRLEATGVFVVQRVPAAVRIVEGS